MSSDNQQQKHTSLLTVFGSSDERVLLIIIHTELQTSGTFSD